MKPRKKKIDEIDVTSRLLNIILDMPLEQQLDLLDQLDISGCDGSRKHARTDLAKPWVVLVDSEKERIFDDCFIKDISRCGMFIETGRSFSIGREITIKFQVPASQKIFKIIGEVVRSQKNGIQGIGVKFKRQLFQDSEI